jgi:hypothetical protein
MLVCCSSFCLVFHYLDGNFFLINKTTSFAGSSERGAGMAARLRLVLVYSSLAGPNNYL